VGQLRALAAPLRDDRESIWQKIMTPGRSVTPKRAEAALSRAAERPAPQELLCCWPRPMRASLAIENSGREDQVEAAVTESNAALYVARTTNLALPAVGDVEQLPLNGKATIWVQKQK